jgi:hypothetical protein
MANTSLNNRSTERLSALQQLIKDKKTSNALAKAYTASEGNWADTLKTLQTSGTDEATLKQLDFTHDLADTTGNNVPLIQALQGLPGVTSLRDLALGHDAASLQTLITPAMVPAGTAGDTPQAKAAAYAGDLETRLFQSQTSAVLQRMATQSALPIADATVQAGVARFFNNQPAFNIRTTSVYTGLKDDKALDGVAPAAQAAVIDHLKSLQRLQAVSPAPQAIPALMNAGINSAQQIADMTPKGFAKTVAGALDADTATQVYQNAVDVKVRNEHALAAMKDTVRGTGVAAIDGKTTVEERIASFNQIAQRKTAPVDWEGLFGSVDFCACADCNSVYGPASYLVELLNYLRNNNLDPSNANTGVAGIAGTPLEQFFRRRPDIGCLELTCANANTVMPYIDLVNEIMESFVVHQSVYDNSTVTPKQIDLDVWNVEGESSSDLLAQPQHTNYQAYCILKSAVYPFTLPYHQPIDAIRIFLDYLQSSRYELLDTFRSRAEADIDAPATPPVTPDPNAAAIATLVDEAICRAVDAEFLGLTQEQYVILTKQAFWEKHYFELRCNTTLTDEQYQKNIKVHPVWEYYGYTTEADMLSIDETAQIGLTFVQKQYLVRTGLLYTDLINLLETRFINPYLPQGKALDIMESLTFSYRFLQTLVTTPSTDPNRFAKLIAFLEEAQTVVPALEAKLHPDPCHQGDTASTISSDDLSQWVKCYFEPIGKLIVLDSGDGPTLPFQGTLGGYRDNKVGGGSLTIDGKLLDATGAPMGQVTASGSVVDTTGKSLDTLESMVMDSAGRRVGYINKGYLYDIRTAADTQAPPVVKWLPAGDSCDLSKVRLIHLDGTVLTSDEYDKMQRFIRLWYAMGWTMDETDKALMGLGALPPDPSTGTPAPATNPKDCFKAFADDCSCTGHASDGCGCNNAALLAILAADITPAFLHELVAVKKLLDDTGLSLIQVLSFWTDIDTVGDDSLYRQLFLTYNLLDIDQVFQADAYGNYLTTAAKISDHVPVLMAAFNLKAADITNIVQLKQLPDSLTLDTVSMIYRYSLLLRILNVNSQQLQDICTIFGDPFVSAWQTWKFLDEWGKMEDYGFTFPQLDYVINNYDNPSKPLKPSLIGFLKLAKTIYDGLNAINAGNPDVNTQDGDIPTAVVPVVANAALAQTDLAQLFTTTVTAQILGLLQGTTVYSTNAPQNLVTSSAAFTALLTGTLATKIKYDYVGGGVQVTGILTAQEVTAAKALFPSADWASAIDRLGQQPIGFFNDVLYGIVTNPLDQQAILQGDVATVTVPIKLFTFLKVYIPFLRERLMHNFIVGTLSTQTGLDTDLTDTLISSVLVSGGQPIIEVFKAINDAYQPPAGLWSGYLIPSSADTYTFAITVQTDTLTAGITLAGQALTFTQQADPNNVYLSNPVKLQPGTAYTLQVTGLDAGLTGLAWKTPTTPRTAIPSSVMLADYLTGNVTSAYVLLQKAGIVASGYSLTAPEVTYLQTNGSDFGPLDFNAVTLAAWLRLGGYTQLRNSLPTTNTSLIQFFAWAKQTTDTTQLSAQISAVTLWLQSDVDKLLAAGHFNWLDNTLFVDERKLLKLQEALYVAAKIAIDINLLFDWAKPVSKFWVCHDIAESIRKSIKARYKETDWETVVKPLNDQLREDQRDALIAYLRVQPDLIAWGVTDANSLFEFFLIDVQMDACMETSRIKQATLSVQLYVQRCFLGLEEPYVVNDTLDADRWEWMQYNSVWVANRQVFLYPENWIESSLRDDKSDFYVQLESEMLQKDITTDNVEDALNNYLASVDGVSNMQVIGLFVDTAASKYHIFSRTRNAPYFFYYRYFDSAESNWYPWEQMQLDISSYDVENANGQITGNGSYLSPVVWNGRLLVFFPQLVKKTVPPATGPVGVSYGSGSATANQATVQYEVKMAWSEYRNGKWTQKQVSTDALYHGLGTDTLPDISAYCFVPVLSTQNVQIQAYYQGAALPGANTFTFLGSKIVASTGVNTVPAFSFPQKFQYYTSAGLPYKFYSFQAATGTAPAYVNEAPYFVDDIDSVQAEVSTEQEFYHPFSGQLLGQLAMSPLPDFFASNLTIPNNLGDDDEAFGAYQDTAALQTNSYSELKTPYALYNWELFFHVPAAVGGKLSGAQQFEAAKEWYEYIFNPGAQGTAASRAWQFYPFTQINADNYLEYLFNSLQANTANADINAWRSNPFEPHLIARGRPSAYMKWIVMQYLDNLIAWADYLFTQHTLETINQATQLYILAYHILGPRPQVIPQRGTILPETYKSLLNKWDAFGNAMVEMELAFPFSNQIDTKLGGTKGDVGFANIFGYATSLYFCLPSNPTLLAYWDTLDDRLYKIRHCENIEGVFGLPPLWDPPIDPALLVAATAQGLSIASVLADLDSPVPNFRFNYLMQKAIELCNELKTLGTGLLSAFEKGDAEALQSLRASQEVTMQNLVMQVKQFQLNEANATIDSLNQNRATPVYRMQHYLSLVGKDNSLVPDPGTDYSPMAEPAQTLTSVGELVLTSYESEDMDKANQAHDWQTAVGVVETIAAALHLIPHFSVDAKPIGIGAGLAFGGMELGTALEAVAKGLQIKVSDLNFQSSNARSKGGYLRQLQDRVSQVNLAGYEIKQIDKQILAQQIRVQMAGQEITNQQQAIDNAQAVSDFLTNKYTNQELYSWMQDSLKTLYYQVYTLAYDLAQKAEKVYRFERGLTSSNFIQFGYWNASRDGLLAGENLYVGLKQLEAAYQMDKGYDFEITKHVSLRQIDPLALLALRETGSCSFEVPEILYDMDFPGHYMRRIRSVALSVPCIAGPYTGINAMLRMTGHSFRLNAIATGKNDYPQSTTQDDPRFMTVNVPITSIAVSNGQNDSGVFDLNFKDERYMPFEGAGAISQWTLTLPSFRQIDYNTITDVIMTIRYVSSDGGDKLGGIATSYLSAYLQSVQDLSQDQGLFAVIDLKNDFPNEWYQAMNLPPAADGREIPLTTITDRLPVYTRSVPANKLVAQDVYIVTPAALQASSVILSQNGNTNNFGNGPKVGTLNVFTLPGIGLPFQTWKLVISDTTTAVDRMWMVVRYTMG